MTDEINPTSQELDLQNLDIYKSYKRSEYLSIKHSSYFQIYEELLSKHRNKEITFVEVGVLNGGSLFMWRNYFGPKARIIGIDFNPIAKKWEKDGFEIYIGSQADVKFWDDFFSAVGDVDIILDDGGHTNEQQIVTAHKCIPYVKDGGMLLVEDTHTSYMKKFGNPSKYSFINYSKMLVDSINSRFPAVHVSNNNLNRVVYSVTFYESIVCFNVDRRKCFVSSPTSNNGISFDAEDYRDHGSQLHLLKDFFGRRFDFLNRSELITRLSRKVFRIALSTKSKLASAKLKKYFQ